MMQMKCGGSCRELKCCVEYDRRLTVIDRVNSGLLPDTVGYAVCRFLCHNEGLSRALVRQSYDLRFAKGKGARSVRRQWVVPAVLLELPGAWVRFSCIVTAKGVTVTRVCLLKEYPGAQ